MSFTVADVIEDVRELVLDTSPLPDYRYSDAFLVRKVNQTLRRACVVRPDLFAARAAITCVAGILQSCPADAYRMMDVITNADDRAVKEINQDTLDLMIPTWPTDTPAAVTNWMRYPRSPTQFYVYPAQQGGETLNIVYAQSPAMLALGDVVPLPDTYMPAIIDGTCWLTEAIDAEHAESGRAKSFKDAFEAALGAGLAVRKVADTESAGAPPAEVL